MRKYIIAAIVALLAPLGLVSLTSAPAQAAAAGRVNHYAPDEGYDPPIIVRLNYGQSDSQRNLYEGEDSYYDRGWPDVDQIFIRDGEELWCLTSTPQGTWFWLKEFDGSGWHKINDWWGGNSRGCTLRKD